VTYLSRIDLGSLDPRSHRNNWAELEAFVPSVALSNPPVMRSPLDASSSFTTVDGTAYWVYVGQVLVTCVPRFIEVGIRAAGTGAQTAEMCLASTPSAPNAAGQTLTKIEATGSIGSLLATTAPIANSSPFSTTVAAGTHLWAGIRTAMATNEPQLHGILDDKLQGYVLLTAAAGALTGSSTFAGTLAAYSSTNAAVAPALTVRI